ncbi:MAG TPA: acyl-CoA dehydrogenase family protein, partial [Rhodothermales bacterium]|nr:acyl-CoA dehydrogenase family protein [Rhodothermales bacterium]
MSALDDFREETRAWLAEHCPPGARGEGQVPTGSSKITIQDPDVILWLDRMIERGWTVPTWPRAYGGAELSMDEYVVLIEELKRIDARPALMGMGTSMIGPTLLEYGTDDQKARHLPSIARGEIAWCQGYSEPGSGSDLASLSTRAVERGDQFVINGQKIWTSGAQYADWMFCLVRTDPQAPKHEGISFVLLTMDQPGVTVKPIRLISGVSPFCETFFDDAVADRSDLVGELNKGWTVGKRLLQHERSGMASLVGAQNRDPGPSLVAVASEFLGTDARGHLDDPALRSKVIAHNMNSNAFALTRRRTVEEVEDGGTPGPATSIFKMYGTELQQEKSWLMCELRGTRGYGWQDPDHFSDDELEWTRAWLGNRAASIYSGTNEIQRNIIAKRVLGL